MAKATMTIGKMELKINGQTVIESEGTTIDLLPKPIRLTSSQREILESLAGHSRYSFTFYRKGMAIKALERRGWIKRDYPSDRLYITYEGRKALRESAGG